MVGEEPTVRASPQLYNTYDACLQEAAKAMTSVYVYLPKEIRDSVSLVHVCTTIPEDT